MTVLPDLLGQGTVAVADFERRAEGSLRAGESMCMALSEYRCGRPRPRQAIVEPRESARERSRRWWYLRSLPATHQNRPGLERSRLVDPCSDLLGRCPRDSGGVASPEADVSSTVGTAFRLPRDWSRPSVPCTTGYSPEYLGGSDNIQKFTVDNFQQILQSSGWLLL